MARISLDALFDNNGTPNEHSRSLVISAKIVVAVDVETADSQVVHGRELVEELIDGPSVQNLPSILEVELDMVTDELKTLCELVKEAKEMT